MQTKNLTFEEADNLCTEIIDFLLDCGGIYTEVTSYLQEVILTSLATDQYLLSRDKHNKINHFLCYKKLGHLLMILEHGNKNGHKGFIDFIKQIREKAKPFNGAVWNHKGEGYVYYPKQRGN